MLHYCLEKDCFIIQKHGEGKQKVHLLLLEKNKKDILVLSCWMNDESQQTQQGIDAEKAKLVKREVFFFTYTNNLFGFSHTLDFELSWLDTQLLQWDHCISTKLLRRKHTVTHCKYHGAVHNSWYTMCDRDNSAIFEFCPDGFLKYSISCIVYRSCGLIEN